MRKPRIVGHSRQNDICERCERCEYHVPGSEEALEHDPGSEEALGTRFD